MKISHKTPFALAMSASLLPFAASAAQTDNNPFTLSELSSGYLQTAEAEKDGTSKMKDGACGEGKCGGSMMNKASDNKAIEGKCAGNKPEKAPSGDKATESKKTDEAK